MKRRILKEAGGAAHTDWDVHVYFYTLVFRDKGVQPIQGFSTRVILCGDEEHRGAKKEGSND